MNDIFNETEKLKIQHLKKMAGNTEVKLATRLYGTTYLDSVNIKYEVSALLYELNIVIAGGCFTSWYHDETVKDIDVFFLNCVDDLGNPKIPGIMANYESNIPLAHRITSKAHYHNSNIISTLMDVADVNKFQFIFTKFKTRQELIEHFDYKHCCVSYYKEKLYITRSAYDAIKNKELIVNNTESFANLTEHRQRRNQKFLDRGFKVKGVTTSPHISDILIKNDDIKLIKDIISDTTMFSDANFLKIPQPTPQPLPKSKITISTGNSFPGNTAKEMQFMKRVSDLFDDPYWHSHMLSCVDLLNDYKLSSSVTVKNSITAKAKSRALEIISNNPHKFVSFFENLKYDKSYDMMISELIQFIKKESPWAT